MIGLLRGIRAVVGFFFLLQVLHLLPVLTWIENPAGVTNKMIGVLILKVFFLGLFGGIFYGLRVAIHRMYKKRYGTPHPKIAKNWMAL